MHSREKTKHRLKIDITSTDYSSSVLAEERSSSPTKEMVALLSMIEKLLYLSDHYKPNSNFQKSEVESLLKEFTLEEDLDNPNYIQDRILALLDFSEKELEKRLQ